MSTSPGLIRNGLPDVVVNVATAFPAAKATVPTFAPLMARASVTAPAAAVPDLAADPRRLDAPVWFRPR